jgi:CheY-like chemotaxis protein
MARILMIDDDPDIVFAIRIPLEACGHEFFSAGSGREGLEMVKKVRPDLILLDVMMESFTEGFHVSLALRDPSPDSDFAPFRSVPILMLTSIHSATTLRFEPDMDYLPVDAFLEKSASPEELLARVNQLLGAAAKKPVTDN